MRPSPSIRLPAVAACLGLLCASFQASALQDIDLYAGGAGSAPPNVLFYLDNSANWSANNNAWRYSTVHGQCATKYASSPAKQATCQQNTNLVFCGRTSACSGDITLEQGRVELRAIQMVLRATYCNATGARKLRYNVGVMMGANASAAGSPDGASVGTSYIRHAVRPMSDDQCLASAPAGADLTQYLMADLTHIDGQITDSAYKTSSSFEYGAGFYEAFKYFGGWTDPSRAPGTSLGGASGVAGSPADSTHFGPERYSVLNPMEDVAAFTDSGRRTYQSPIGSLGSCGRNYIVLIGNTFPNQEFGTDQNATTPTNTLLSRLGWRPSQLFRVANKSSIRFGDEWAKFLADTDVSDAPGRQNVKTFAIDVFNAAADANQTALLKSIGAAGQESEDFQKGYVAIGGDVQALIDALTDILTQVAGVNSVFASAALPVSVNAQGSYLNQIYVGLFRPDEDGQQRWYGNLKQFRFKANGNGTLYLADADGRPAVDSSSSGFIQHCARSHWTTDSGAYWEKILPDRPSACDTQSSSRYSDLPDGPMVERGGAAQVLRQTGWTRRNLRTCASPTDCSSLTDFTAATFDTVTLSRHGASSAMTTSEKQELANWVLGRNVGDGHWSITQGASQTTYGTLNSEGRALDTNSTRPTVHGEVVHSTPLAVNYGSGAANDIVVFYGAGDGTFRAVDGNPSGPTAGRELWAFIAPEHYAKLERLRSNHPLISYHGMNLDPALPKSYFFDGPVTGHQDANPLTRLWLYAGMRRGGNMLYAFDASRKPDATRQPSVMWRFGCASPGTGCVSGRSGESSMGQTWSPPTVIRVKGVDEPLVVFGGGYDDCEDSENPASACADVARGKGVYVMSAQRGSDGHYRHLTPAPASYTTSAGTLGIMPGRFVAGVAPVDVDGDGHVDLLYAADTRGNLWRIHTSDPASGFAAYPNGVQDWPAPVLVAVVSDWSAGAEKRKFMAAPNVIVTSTSQALVLIGTGDREKPSAASTAAQVRNRFYGLKDTFRVAAPTPAVGFGQVPPGTHLADLMNVTGRTTVNAGALAVTRGWFLDLYTTSVPYEQVVTTPLTLGGITYFNTYQARQDARDGSCSNLGTARGYQIDFLTGVMQVNAKGDRSPSTYLSQGIPTDPVGGSVHVDGTDRWFCLSCGKSSTILDPAALTVAPNARRTPVYRYIRNTR